MPKFCITKACWSDCGQHKESFDLIIMRSKDMLSSKENSGLDAVTLPVE